MRVIIKQNVSQRRLHTSSTADAVWVANTLSVGLDHKNNNSQTNRCCHQNPLYWMKALYMSESFKKSLAYYWSAWQIRNIMYHRSKTVTFKNGPQRSKTQRGRMRLEEISCKSTPVLITIHVIYRAKLRKLNDCTIVFKTSRQGTQNRPNLRNLIG